MSRGGRTHLVLLPGMDGTAIMFGPLLAVLPSEITPHVVEYPTTGPNGYDDLLPLVERTVAALPECVVLGWSFSGPLALRAAARHPGISASNLPPAGFVVLVIGWSRTLVGALPLPLALAQYGMSAASCSSATTSYCRSPTAAVRRASRGAFRSRAPSSASNCTRRPSRPIPPRTRSA